MSEAARIRVEVKRDHLLKLASGEPESALSEIIWNSLDADASEVRVVFHEGPLGPIDEIVVSDDGTGIPYQRAATLFSALGGSWKPTKPKTDGGRFLHGRDGKGRFKAFALGARVTWQVVYRDNGKLWRYAIEGRNESLDEFALTDRELCEETQTGVRVQIRDLNKSFHLLEKDTALQRLTPIFAPYLSNYSSARLTIDGTAIDPAEVIRNREDYDLEKLEEDGELFPVTLELVEWNGVDDRELWFCDENGFPLEVYGKQIRGIGDFRFAGYLKSAAFPRLHAGGLLAISDLHPKLHSICSEAITLIKDYFRKRTLESNKDQLQKWKEEQVYPYDDDPKSPVEHAERQVFDIVALSINENLPDFEKTDSRTKTFQFRMLRQALEKSPGELQTILQEVIQLPKDKQADFRTVALHREG